MCQAPGQDSIDEGNDADADDRDDVDADGEDAERLTVRVERAAPILRICTVAGHCAHPFISPHSGCTLPVLKTGFLSPFSTSGSTWGSGLLTLTQPKSSRSTVKPDAPDSKVSSPCTPLVHNTVSSSLCARMRQGTVRVPPTPRPPPRSDGRRRRGSRSRLPELSFLWALGTHSVN